MSVINQVLKDLDRQGANTSVPSGVIAINQRDAAAPRWPWLLLAGAMLAAAAWWFWPAAPAPRAAIPSPPPALSTPVETAPQLQLSQQLSPLPEPAHVGRNPRKGEAESVSAEAQRPRSSEAPSANAPTVEASAPATIIAKPRLDTRLPEPRPPELRQPEVAKAQVVKEIKPLTPQAQAEEAWRQASRLLEQGRNHDAQDKLESALRLDPAHAGARQSLIALVLEAGDGARAETLLREGLALQANDPWYPRSLAQLQLQRGDYAQAAAILKTGLGKRPDTANWGLYASTLAKLGKPGDAAQAYREALRPNPAQGGQAERGNWWIGLAVALEQNGEKVEAAAAYQRALQTRLSSELREFAQQKARELVAR
ncbi:MAG: tetratricopeptide repeat protein [Pseudomonadota bacterium]|nr:tetratricopeptide repeat protein [Pseudomonadota bacterium]